MIFRVRWERTALNELTEIWLQAASAMRHAITAATFAIDQQLKSNPFSTSESRQHGRRVMFEAPLGVTFAVDENSKLVSVLRVWSFRKRAK